MIPVRVHSRFPDTVERNIELDAIRMEFYQNAEAIYLPDYGIDRACWPEIVAHAGILTGIRVSRGVDRAYLDPAGELCLACEVLDEDGDTIVDLLFWNCERPDDVGTAVGAAVGLGLSQVRNPATFHDGWPLLVHRTVLGWLRAGCRGVVIIDRRSARQWLAEAPGPIAGEDAEHARELARLLDGVVDPRLIMRPTTGRVRS